MSVGQENDDRKYRRLKKTDYYEFKAALEAEKRQPESFPHCQVCGKKIRGQTFGVPPDDVTCLRCWSEGSG